MRRKIKERKATKKKENILVAVVSGYVLYRCQENRIQNREKFVLKLKTGSYFGRVERALFLLGNIWNVHFFFEIIVVTGDGLIRIVWDLYGRVHLNFKKWRICFVFMHYMYVVLNFE